MTSCGQEPRFVSHCSDHGNEEICRRKRCSDRYDSSESSDSGVVTSVSEDAFSTSTSDLLDLDSPRSNDTDEDSFTLSQDVTSNQEIDKHESWRHKMSWPEDSDPSAFLSLDDDFGSISQYFTRILSKDVNKLDFSFSNDSDFLQFLHCSSSKTDSGIGTEESSESSHSSQRLSSDLDEACFKSQSSCLTPREESSSRIRFPATQNWLNNNYGPPKVYVCKWEDCTAKYSIVSHLVHHVQTIHVITQRHLGHFTCLWEHCRHYGISYNCAPSWPDHHMLTHTGKTFECFIPGCKRIFKTEVLQRRHITHHLDSISTQSSNNQSKYRDSPVAKSTRKINKKLKQRRIPYSANRPDYFDQSVMENLVKRLQIFEQCSQGIIEYNHDMSISVCLQNRVVASRTLLSGAREKLVRYYPSSIVDEEWIPMNRVIEKCKKIAWSLVSDTGKFYLMKFLSDRQKLIHEKCSDLAKDSRCTLPHKTDKKKVLHQCERNNNSVPSNQNFIVKRSSRAKSARKIK